ncbi:tRNA-splicing endonuclease subunit Sen15-like isoform X2 [Zootermopsis nevadensis]|uniref:tRNA-splicing endonuclease subunit Sen15 n=1 Tax=Zootermopsis nevadensis TaxID=136037 RepID=A0A067RA98_ZOONE|nr:tRNA-splicing endonuclease subunit Sen15-like isoform X2 [Zootermopsis nevadensis]KDR20531.1 tRNA-splicing endonuclease subunit Sen15 [Zootermopsis nevadensis]
MNRNMADYPIHPVQQDMVNLGCRNQLSVGIAFQVYMDLCEVQAMEDVRYVYSHELDLIYLLGKTQRGPQSASRTEIFLPLSTASEITPAWIQKVQDTLCTDKDKKGITLAMKEHDSTVVYYRLTQGLVPPDSPETARRKKQHNEQKHFIEVEMRRMEHRLLDRALKARSSEEKEKFPSTSNEQVAGSSASTDHASGREESSADVNDEGAEKGRKDQEISSEQAVHKDCRR